ncbi:Alpha-L-fucosidase [Habropoda laboriosa]|uniref:Putative alpha-L-fucosidase n=1 Tax=Habropoda laboriosa TaxID=597456 RepID=A0A0L7R9D7_9HYME|nr:PREDICTED: alpha-L-fucosidase [Habropoda laboriosa]KOC67449.1 Alpha-L-fucosidase [Habropoda laboriosa]
MILSIYIVLSSLVLCTSWGNQYIVVTADKEDSETLWPSETEINQYSPTWDSLDSRPLPNWYDDAKFGIFIHWGVFSVPSFGSEWFWYNWQEEHTDTKYDDFMKQRYPPNFTYQDFAHEFTAEFFNATQWSELFQASGAKYIVMTSKHHEGYTLWPSKYSFSWNSVDVGPRKDLIGEVATAIRDSTNLKFGVYHSMYEWYNPHYLSDKHNNFTTQNFVKQKTVLELLELIEKYKPEVIWSDGDWEASDTYWQSKEFLAWLYNKSPVKDTVVVNDRWGKNIPCHHGDFYTCTDRFNPGVLLPHKWENCMTIDRKSWGFRRNAVLSEYFTLPELVKELAVTVSCGGNLLVNVGPTKDGIITPIFEERLRGMGDWLEINGEAIYSTKPWIAQNDTLTNNVWYTQHKNKKQIYAIILEWPNDGILHLGSFRATTGTQISLLGSELLLEWTQNGKKLTVNLQAEFHKGQPAWVLKMKQK